MKDWYENIEEPVRDMVKLLRNNGFNTTCSCGHKMYIEGDLIEDYKLKEIHDLLYNYCAENNKPLNYEIIFELKVSDGYLLHTRFCINFKK